MGVCVSSSVAIPQQRSSRNGATNVTEQAGTEAGNGCLSDAQALMAEADDDNNPPPLNAFAATPRSPERGTRRATSSFPSDAGGSTHLLPTPRLSSLQSPPRGRDRLSFTSNASNSVGNSGLTINLNPFLPPMRGGGRGRSTSNPPAAAAHSPFEAVPPQSPLTPIVAGGPSPRISLMSDGAAEEGTVGMARAGAMAHPHLPRIRSSSGGGVGGSSQRTTSNHHTTTSTATSALSSRRLTNGGGGGGGGGGGRGGAPHASYAQLSSAPSTMHSMSGLAAAVPKEKDSNSTLGGLQRFSYSTQTNATDGGTAGISSSNAALLTSRGGLSQSHAGGGVVPLLVSGGGEGSFSHHSGRAHTTGALLPPSRGMGIGGRHSASFGGGLDETNELSAAAADDEESLSFSADSDLFVATKLISVTFDPVRLPFREAAASLSEGGDDNSNKRSPRDREAWAAGSAAATRPHHQRYFSSMLMAPSPPPVPIAASNLLSGDSVSLGGGGGTAFRSRSGGSGGLPFHPQPPPVAFRPSPPPSSEGPSPLTSPLRRGQHQPHPNSSLGLRSASGGGGGGGGAEKDRGGSFRSVLGVSGGAFSGGGGVSPPPTSFFGGASAAPRPTSNGIHGAFKPLRLPEVVRAHRMQVKAANEAVRTLAVYGQGPVAVHRSGGLSGTLAGVSHCSYNYGGGGGGGGGFNSPAVVASGGGAALGFHPTPPQPPSSSYSHSRLVPQHRSASVVNLMGVGGDTPSSAGGNINMNTTNSIIMAGVAGLMRSSPQPTPSVLGRSPADHPHTGTLSSRPSLPFTVAVTGLPSGGDQSLAQQTPPPAGIDNDSFAAGGGGLPRFASGGGGGYGYGPSAPSSVVAVGGSSAVTIVAASTSLAAPPRAEVAHRTDSSGPNSIHVLIADPTAHSKTDSSDPSAAAGGSDANVSGTRFVSNRTLMSADFGPESPLFHQCGSTNTSTSAASSSEASTTTNANAAAVAATATGGSEGPSADVPSRTTAAGILRARADAALRTRSRSRSRSRGGAGASPTFVGLPAYENGADSSNNSIRVGVGGGAAGGSVSVSVGGGGAPFARTISSVSAASASMLLGATATEAYGQQLLAFGAPRGGDMCSVAQYRTDGHLSFLASSSANVSTTAADGGGGGVASVVASPVRTALRARRGFGNNSAANSSAGDDAAPDSVASDATQHPIVAVGELLLLPSPKDTDCAFVIPSPPTHSRSAKAAASAQQLRLATEPEKSVGDEPNDNAPQSPLPSFLTKRPQVDDAVIGEAATQPEVVAPAVSIPSGAGGVGTPTRASSPPPIAANAAVAGGVPNVVVTEVRRRQSSRRTSLLKDTRGATPVVPPLALISPSAASLSPSCGPLHVSASLECGAEGGTGAADGSATPHFSVATATCTVGGARRTSVASSTAASPTSVAGSRRNSLTPHGLHAFGSGAASGAGPKEGAVLLPRRRQSSLLNANTAAGQALGDALRTRVALPEAQAV